MADHYNRTPSTCYLQVVCGIKGESILQVLPSFDVVKGVPVDYMHCVLLGLVRKLLSLWFDRQSGNSKNEWFVHWTCITWCTIRLCLVIIWPGSQKYTWHCMYTTCTITPNIMTPCMHMYCTCTAHAHVLLQVHRQSGNRSGQAFSHHSPSSICWKSSKEYWKT